MSRQTGAKIQVRNAASWFGEGQEARCHCQRSSTFIFFSHCTASCKVSAIEAEFEMFAITEPSAWDLPKSHDVAMREQDLFMLNRAGPGVLGGGLEPFVVIDQVALLRAKSKCDKATSSIVAHDKRTTMRSSHASLDVRFRVFVT
jgi:hypothetical protein